MSRPPFLVSPSSWLRSQREARDPVEYAAAIESPKPSRVHWDEVALYVIAAAVVVLFFAGEI